MNLPAKVLLNILYENEGMPKWNPTILEEKILKVEIHACCNKTKSTKQNL